MSQYLGGNNLFEQTQMIPCFIPYTRSFTFQAFNGDHPESLIHPSSVPFLRISRNFIKTDHENNESSHSSSVLSDSSIGTDEIYLGPSYSECPYCHKTLSVDEIITHEISCFAKNYISSIITQDNTSDELFSSVSAFMIQLNPFLRMILTNYCNILIHSQYLSQINTNTTFSTGNFAYYNSSSTGSSSHQEFPLEILITILAAHIKCINITDESLSQEQTEKEFVFSLVLSTTLPILYSFLNEYPDHMPHSPQILHNIYTLSSEQSLLPPPSLPSSDSSTSLVPSSNEPGEPTSQQHSSSKELRINKAFR